MKLYKITFKNYTTNFYDTAYADTYTGIDALIRSFEDMGYKLYEVDFCDPYLINVKFWRTIQESKTTGEIVHTWHESMSMGLEHAERTANTMQLLSLKEVFTADPV